MEKFVSDEMIHFACGQVASEGKDHFSSKSVPSQNPLWCPAPSVRGAASATAAKWAVCVCVGAEASAALVVRLRSDLQAMPRLGSSHKDSAYVCGGGWRRVIADYWYSSRHFISSEISISPPR